MIKDFWTTEVEVTDVRTHRDIQDGLHGYNYSSWDYT